MTSQSGVENAILPTSKATTTQRYIDIGINLTDPIYRGIYHGTQRHADDLAAVLERSKTAGCQKLIITGSDLEESEKAFELAKSHPGFLYCTVGVHPCSSLKLLDPSSSSSFSSPAGSDDDDNNNNSNIADTDAANDTIAISAPLLSSLRALALSASLSGHCVAYGEIGLDYDRLALCPRRVQLAAFGAQLDVAAGLGLPLFLHSRAAAADFARLLRARLRALPRRGVVHSFTGTRAEMRELVGLGFDVGLNGCSLKTAASVDVVRELPLERLQLETDGPWCEMRPGHASAAFLGPGGSLQWKSVKKERFVEGAMVKGRNEPCMIGRVAEAVAAIKGVSVELVAERAWENTVRMFGLRDPRDDA